MTDTDKASTATAETDAKSNDSSKRYIAEWKGTDASPRIDGATAREISRKEAKDGLLMETTRDIRWDHEHAYRADVTDEPEAFREWLGKNGFKVTEE